MQRLKLFIPLVIFLALAGLLWKGLQLDPTAMPSAMKGRTMPAFQLPSLQDANRILSQADLPEQVHLINVWGTWCPTCVVEHPYLMYLAAQGLPIIGVNYKDEREDALQWLAQRGDPYQFNIFDETGMLGIDLGVFGAPETYVVDARGVIRYRYVGELNERVWLKELKPLIDQLQQQADG